MNGAAATRPGEPAPPHHDAARPRRILAVGNMYPPHHAGGYELMWQAAMAHARALGHRVRILTTDYRRAGALEESEPDVHRELRWYWDLERYEFPRLGPLQRLAVERHNAASLRAHLRALEPDLVSWWSMGCMSLSLIEQVRRAGIPAHFVVHDDWLVYGPTHDQWLRMWRGRRRLLAPLAERLLSIPTTVSVTEAGPLVFNSRHTLQRACEAGHPSAAMRVIPPGIDEALIDPAPPTAWRGRLAYVGRIDRQKGIDTAVRALAHLDQATTLEVWGTGDEDYVAECHGLAAQLGVAERLRVCGWADPQRRDRVYREADAIVFPVRWEEPFGLVPIEAMAAGRPVISTARGGSAEYLRDGENALVFGADDAQGLARCVRRLAGDAGLRERLHEHGLATARRYSLSCFATDTVDAMLAAAAART